MWYHSVFAHNKIQWSDGVSLEDPEIWEMMGSNRHEIYATEGSKRPCFCDFLQGRAVHPCPPPSLSFPSLHPPTTKIPSYKQTNTTRQTRLKKKPDGSYFKHGDTVSFTHQLAFIDRSIFKCENKLLSANKKSPI